MTDTKQGEPGLLQRLQATEAKIEEICSISGNAGLPGVSCTKVAPDSGIVYHLGSLTKFITCAAVAVLVEQGKLKWESKVLVVLPGFPQKYPEVEQNATLVDILAHRIALEGRVSYWAQMHNQLLLPTEKSLNVLGALASTGKFRKDLKHNKWTYGAAGDILEKLPGRL